MKKIQKNAARFDNLKQDFLDDKKYSGTAEATLNGYRYDITRFLKFLSDEQLAVNDAGFKRSDNAVLTYKTSPCSFDILHGDVL